MLLSLWHVSNLSDLVVHGIEYKKYSLSYKIAGTILVQAVKLAIAPVNSLLCSLINFHFLWEMLSFELDTKD